jgi:hypothetical protein
MAGHRPAMHGRDHRIGGADPIDLPISSIAVSAQPFTSPGTGVATAVTWVDFGTPSSVPEDTFSWPSGGDHTKVHVHRAGMVIGYYTYTFVGSLPAPSVLSYMNMVTYGTGFISSIVQADSSAAAIYSPNGSIPGYHVWNLPASDDVQLLLQNDTGGDLPISIAKMTLIRIGPNIDVDAI